MDVKRIVQEVGAYGGALVRKDGSLVHAELPSSINRGTFSIMSATIYGAAYTAQSEIFSSKIKKVVVEMDSGHWMIIYPTDDQNLLVLLVDEEGMKKLERAPPVNE